MEDGPGIRSVVFFKGCPLRCVFCQNPEARETGVEIGFYPRKCIRCGNCVDACDKDAIDLEASGRIVRDICDRCGDCADACPSGAISMIGKPYTADALAEILARDLPYYRHSDGGVTLSGGEATLFPDFAGDLLRRLKTMDIHTVLETCGYFDWGAFEQAMLPYLDMIFLDVKFGAPDTHRQHTGKSNRRILDNLRNLVSGGHDVRPRIPIIPGITDTTRNLSEIVEILTDIGAATVELLPYNPVGFQTAESLGKTVPQLPEKFMRPAELDDVHTRFGRILEKKSKCRNAFPQRTVGANRPLRRSAKV